MAFCAQCEKEIEEGQVCGCAANAEPQAATDKAGLGKFFASLKNRTGIGSRETNATEVYERNMRIVPDCITPNENEIPVRQYDVAVLRNLIRAERAEGRMQVTNKRVIFRAAGTSLGGRIALQQEFAIDELAGIEAICNYRFGFIYLLCGLFIVALAAVSGFGIIYKLSMGHTTGTFRTYGLIFGLCGLAPFFLIRGEFLFKLLPLGFSLGAFAILWRGTDELGLFVLVLLSAIITMYGLMLYCFKPNLVILIKNKGAMPQAAPITIARTRSFWKFWQDEKDAGFSEVFPTPATESAIREIGAMIADIQKLGDFGLKKWVS